MWRIIQPHTPMMNLSLTQKLFLGLFSLGVSSTSFSAPESGLTVEQLYHKPHLAPNTPLAQRVEAFSEMFLGRPYELGALGEGPNGDYDQYPLYRMDAFDCETFVDTVLALALATTPQEFQNCIASIRYHDNKISFITRNHFTDLDWNTQNQTIGLLKDITLTIKDKTQRPIAKMAHATINKPGWYQHLTLKAIRIHGLSPKEKAIKLQSLQKEGATLAISPSSIAYLPTEQLINDKGQENTFIFNQIPHGAVIEIVRPNWALEDTIGTNLNVSHLGFAIWKGKTLYFRHAGLSNNKVMDIKLSTYLQKMLQSPTIKGINIQMLAPSTAKPTLCSAHE